jgi:hypothetical protein
MNLDQLNTYVFRYKAVLFAVCIVIVLYLMGDNRLAALSVARVFMCLSSVGDMVLGWYKYQAGMGFVQTLLVPALMFIVFLALAIFLSIMI